MFSDNKCDLIGIDNNFNIRCIKIDRFAQMRASGDYFVTVIEDTRKSKIIGSATLVLEKKFIRNCAIVRIIFLF